MHSAEYRIRTVKACILLMLLALSCSAAGISTKAIDPNKVTEIVLSKSCITTLQFPAQVTGVYGAGIVTSQQKGSVQLERAPSQPVIVLRALNDDGAAMVVLMNDRMYVFKLVVGNPPDVAVTLTTDASVQGTSREASDDEVIANRPRFDSQTLTEIAERVKRAASYALLQPQLYQGYKHRECSLISDDGSVKTIVTSIHQLPEYDAIILQGTVENNSDGVLTFSADHTGVSIDKVQRPVTLLECQRTIAPHSSTTFLVEVIGDLDGSRAAYSVDNDYRFIINTGYHIKK